MEIPSGPLVNTCIYYENWITISVEQQEYAALSAYQNFLYALKAKETKRQYPSRLDKFISFLGIQGTLEEKCLKLHRLSRSISTELLESHLIRFINFQKSRIENREIAEGTLHKDRKSVV